MQKISVRGLFSFAKRPQMPFVGRQGGTARFSPCFLSRSRLFAQKTQILQKIFFNRRRKRRKRLSFFLQYGIISAYGCVRRARRLSRRAVLCGGEGDLFWKLTRLFPILTNIFATNMPITTNCASCRATLCRKCRRRSAVPTAEIILIRCRRIRCAFPTRKTPRLFWSS